MFDLRNYSDIFGKPKTGVHKYRFMSMALVDIISTILVGLIIAYITKLKPQYVILGLFLLGIVLHAVFNVRTTVDKLIFPSRMYQD
jgi:F0F1-type ATP synthase assembly protein I